MHTISKKPPGLLVAMFDQVPTPEVLHDLWDELDLHGSGVVVMSPRHIPHTVPDASVDMRGDLTVYLGGKQMDEVRQDLLDWEHLGIAPRCFADAKSLEMLELLSKRSEERYTRTCFVGETIEDDEEDDSPLMELERFDDSLSPMEQEQLPFISTIWHCQVQWMSRSAEPCGGSSHRRQGLQSGDCTVSSHILHLRPSGPS